LILIEKNNERKLFTLIGAIFVKTTQMKQISIRKIQYTNFSNKALCYGVLTLNNLSIESCIELSFSHLNRLITSINKQLAVISIYDLIQEEQYDSEVYYTINLSDYLLDDIVLNTNDSDGFQPLRISA
jgi:hypothetical protein